MVIMSNSFNMTGHRYWPLNLDRKDTSHTTNDKSSKVPIKNLYSFRKRLEKNHVNSKTITNLTYSILWYKKPGWINLHTANKALESECEYSNCVMTDVVGHIDNHSAIVFTMTQQNEFSPPIKKTHRRQNQVWIFFGLESPVNHKYLGHRHSSWLNTMNWSMSYRTDSDIFFPYGILEPKEKVPTLVQSEVFRQKTKDAAWIVSHCGADSLRDEYVQEMKAAGLQVRNNCSYLS